MLDRTKPYGDICGGLAEAPRARYEQGGRLFDRDGLPVEPEPAPADADGSAGIDVVPRRGPGRPRKVDA